MRVCIYIYIVQVTMYVCSWNQLPLYASFFQWSSPRFAKSARSKISAAPGMTDSGLWDGRPPGWQENCRMEFPPNHQKYPPAMFPGGNLT